MKIYLFNPETGIYLGEDFSDEPSMCKERDAIPRDATTVAPPSFASGEVPVFAVAGNRWEIRPICAVKGGNAGISLG